MARTLAERELGDAEQWPNFIHFAKAEINGPPRLEPLFDLDKEPQPVSTEQIAAMEDGKVFCRLATSTGSHIDGVFKRAKHSNKFVVLFPSALPKDARLPFLPRWSWVDSIDANVWCFEEDIARKYGLLGGWFQESTHFHADAVAALITEIARAIGVPNSGITLTGSSLGGFGAMMVAPCLPGCLVIADVPQTDLAAYVHRSHITALCSKIYGTDDIASISESYKERFSVIARYKSVGIVPDILILHELSDEPSGRQQIYSFLEELGALRKELDASFSVRCHIRCLGNGHTSISKGEFVQLLSKEGRL